MNQNQNEIFIHSKRDNSVHNFKVPDYWIDYINNTKRTFVLFFAGVNFCELFPQN